jgi:hypothetical protein
MADFQRYDFTAAEAKTTIRNNDFSGGRVSQNDKSIDA